MKWLRRRSRPAAIPWRSLLVSERWRPEHFEPEPLTARREHDELRQPLLGALLGALLLLAVGLATFLLAPT